jgi:hypothetical protein
VGNHDFEDLTLAMDEEAWCEALRTAYSFRALNELVLMGQITVPFRLVNSRDFVPRSLYEGGEQGLALARHLEGRGPDVDILCRGEPFILLMTHITYAPTVQYLLRRLLDVADVPFGCTGIRTGVSRRLTESASTAGVSILSPDLCHIW